MKSVRDKVKEFINANKRKKLFLQMEQLNH